MRVLFGAGVSAAAVGAGFWVRSRYGQMQMSLGAVGAGIAGGYATLAAAAARYDLVPDWLALPARGRPRGARRRDRDRVVVRDRGGDRLARRGARAGPAGARHRPDVALRRVRRDRPRRDGGAGRAPPLAAAPDRDRGRRRGSRSRWLAIDADTRPARAPSRSSRRSCSSCSPPESGCSSPPRRPTSTRSRRRTRSPRSASPCCSPARSTMSTATSASRSLGAAVDLGRLLGGSAGAVSLARARARRLVAVARRCRHGRPAVGNGHRPHLGGRVAPARRARVAAPRRTPAGDGTRLLRRSPRRTCSSSMRRRSLSSTIRSPAWRPPPWPRSPRALVGRAARAGRDGRSHGDGPPRLAGGRPVVARSPSRRAPGGPRARRRRRGYVCARDPAHRPLVPSGSPRGHDRRYRRRRMRRRGRRPGAARRGSSPPRSCGSPASSRSRPRSTCPSSRSTR